VGRALSLSLAAHAAFVLSFLLLSATRQPLIIPQIVRPVRLVTYLEPLAAPRPRAAIVPEPATARAAPALPAAPPARQPAIAEHPSPAPAAAPPAPIPGTRLEIPSPQSAPPARNLERPDETRPALSERLARRLAATTAAVNRPAEAAPPQPRLARLQRPEPAATPPNTAAAVGESSAHPPESVMPVGYFPHAWYLAVLKERIFARWSPPSEFFQSNPPPAALVSFRIARDGRIGSIALKDGSGSARFDQSVLAAIRSLGQVPALPEQYGEENLDVVIRFQNQR